MGKARKSADTPLDTLTRPRALLDGLFARVPEAIVLLDTGDRILEVNQEFTRVFGYANEEACGHLIQELIVPEELLTEVEEYARRAVEGESLNYETLRKRKDGTRVHVSVISGPVSVADSHISHYIIYRDTSLSANGRSRGYVKVKPIWRKRRDSAKLAVGHGIPRPVISDTGRRCATACWGSIPLARHRDSRNSFSDFIRTIKRRAGQNPRKSSATKRISNGTTGLFIRKKGSGTFTPSAIRSLTDPAISVSTWVP